MHASGCLSMIDIYGGNIRKLKTRGSFDGFSIRNFRTLMNEIAKLTLNEVCLNKDSQQNNERVRGNHRVTIASIRVDGNQLEEV